MKPKFLNHAYRHHLSDYYPDIESGKWHSKYLEKADEQTGEVLKGKPLYVFESKNVGEKMSIDDKCIGHDGYTILSNGETGKMAEMIESCKAVEVGEMIELFGDDAKKIKIISCDMSPTYISVCNKYLPDAKIVIDKFHVMQYLYDAVLDVRTSIKKELAEQLSKGKIKTENDKIILSKMAILKHCRYRLTQSPEKWSEDGKGVMNQAFALFPKLKTAYDLSQNFKKWYDIGNSYKKQQTIFQELFQWYKKVELSGLKEFNSFVKMVQKHETEIINYFICGQTSARAERLNGKINRFASNNFGIKDKDFFLYRLANYFK